MSSRWSDLDRPPLSQARLRRALASARWPELTVVESTESTNVDVAALLRGGSDTAAVVAEEQTAGRGRLGRGWQAPPRSSVLLSVGFVPAVTADAWPLLALLAGCAAADALAAVAALEARLKWPNDLLAGDRKVGGILAERVDRGSAPAAVVIGMGINVSLRPSELPVPTAGSIALAGGGTDREPLVAELLRGLDRGLTAFEDSGGDATTFMPRYRRLCATMGADVQLELPEGRVIRGRAADVADDGRLVLRDDHGAESRWSAGDVTHVRNAEPA